MDIDPATRERIAELIAKNPIVLFMKGDRAQPQCGFSAQVVQMLDSLLPDYATCDVLADPGIRNGIKAFSSWPTIPQLYVRGEFLGGCDIVRDLYASGELHERLGVPRPSQRPPSLTITEAAARALRQIAAERPGQALHLSVDARFQSTLYLGPEEPGEIRVEAGGLALLMDPQSASRADGVVIDAVDTDRGSGFHIRNPNAPAAVEQLTPQEVKAMLDAGEPVLFLDVRTHDERQRARIEGTRLLDEDAAREIEALDRDTPLVFHCHLGGRSQAAAEHFASLGFRRVYNVVGGIDAWSVEIDPGVPRY